MYLSPLEKIFSLEKSNKNEFFFVFCSLIRIFAAEKGPMSGCTSAMSKLAALGLH